MDALDAVYDRLVADEKLKQGTKYERLVAMVLKIVEREATVRHQVRLSGTGETVHAIDVLVERPDATKAAEAERDDHEREPAEDGGLPVADAPATHAGREIVRLVRRDDRTAYDGVGLRIWYELRASS